MDEILIRDLMATEVPVIQSTDSLGAAVRQMAVSSLACLLVVDGLGKAEGILTERDMLAFTALVLEGKLDWSERTRDHMSTNLVYLKPEQSLFEALVVARAKEVRHLPVLGDDGRIAGMITSSELVRAHFSVFESQREAAEEQVSVRREDLASVTARLRTLSLQDPLLEIGNRRALEDELRHTEGASRRYQHTYSVALFDVDHFKAYNDEYGHPAGDRVLQQIVRVFTDGMRTSDRLYRYGGEEILLLMPETDVEGATIVAERMRSNLEATAIPHATADRRVVTVSGGVAEGGFRSEVEGWQKVVEDADRALYRAKRAGRNLIESTATSLVT